MFYKKWNEGAWTQQNIIGENMRYDMQNMRIKRKIKNESMESTCIPLCKKSRQLFTITTPKSASSRRPGRVIKQMTRSFNN